LALCDVVPLQPWVFNTLLIFALICWWAFVLNVLGFMSGWWSLAKAYPHTGHFDGKLRRFRSLKLNWVNVNGAVTIGTNAEGLYLAMFVLFRPGHPPVFIPWEDVSAKVVKGWLWMQYLELRFAKVPNLRMRISEKLGRQIAADANQAWNTGEENETW
jgi:hypothetical protein